MSIKASQLFFGQSGHFCQFSHTAFSVLPQQWPKAKKGSAALFPATHSMIVASHPCLLTVCYGAGVLPAGNLQFSTVFYVRREGGCGVELVARSALTLADVRRLQVADATRDKQLQAWKDLIVSWHTAHKQSTLVVADWPLWSNDAISRTCRE